MQLKKNQNYIEDIKELIANAKQHFYIVFPIVNTVRSQLNWIQYHSLPNSVWERGVNILNREI